MRSATLTRDPSSDEGTFGTFKADYGFEVYSGELPDRGNAPNRSSIPVGKYVCRKMPSPKFGSCYHVLDVPGRMDVLIHAGNFCGDTEKGLRSDVEGCIMLGRAIGELDHNGKKQKALLSSKDALKAFELYMNHEEFELVIR